MRFTLIFILALALLPAFLAPYAKTALSRVEATYAPLKGEITRFDQNQKSSHKNNPPLAAYVEN